MGTFLAELDERVQAFNRDLLALEGSPGQEDKIQLVKELFRTAHSLKGAARSVSATPIEKACHRLEELFAAVRDDGVNLSAERIELLFAAVDAIQEAGKRIKEEGAPEDSALEALLPRLETADWKDPPTQSTDATLSPHPETMRHDKPDAPPSSVGTVAGDPTDADPQYRQPSAAETGIVRVAAGKLDSLIDAAGELLVVRGRIAHRQAEAAALMGPFKEWSDEWPVIVKTLKAAVSRNQPEEEGGKQRSKPYGRRLSRAVEDADNSLRKLQRGLGLLAKNLLSDSKALDQVAAPLERAARNLRMMSFDETCEGLRRVVRDLSKSAGKKVTLVVAGGQIELDRAILQEVATPLLHLIRNAVDHGIEGPAERVAAGKPETGQISVSATLRGNQVEIVVADDGRGIDLNAVRRQIEKKGMTVPDDAQAVAEAVFVSGLSTAGLITEVSGRGLGLDIVRNTVEALRGNVRLSFAPGVGTRFILTLPLTITTLHALLVRVGRQIFALDTASIVELRRITASQIRVMEGREVLPVNGATIPIVSLAGLLNLGESPQARGDEKLPVVLLAVGRDQAAFTVNELIAEREIVVKALGNRIKRIPCADGATVLPSGDIALILRSQHLLRSALGQATSRRSLSAEISGEQVPARKRLLLVEDSVTTRTLEANILGAAGFDVVIAADGMQAWHLLQDQGADLVISDIEMPNMNGFALTEAIRGSRRFRAVPIVLVTALASDADRMRGMEVGADAYLIKSTFDQKELLATIEQLL